MTKDYKKGQHFLDLDGKTWELKDIIESRSLLCNSNPSMVVLLSLLRHDRRKSKLIKVSYQEFREKYSPFLSNDRKSISNIMVLERAFKREIAQP
jgi:hypothetical protein